MVEKALFWFGLGYLFMALAVVSAYLLGYWTGYIRGREDAIREIANEIEHEEAEEGEGHEIQ
ncbi:MAG: hypothetical protein QXS01_06810 [Candidatus Bathyarchaeia archaeon]